MVFWTTAGGGMTASAWNPAVVMANFSLRVCGLHSEISAISSCQIYMRKRVILKE
jgi:hypothetical protein